MLDRTSLPDDLRRNALARAGLRLLEQALARRTPDERSAFWRAVDIHYATSEVRASPGAGGATEVYG